MTCKHCKGNDRSAGWSAEEIERRFKEMPGIQPEDMPRVDGQAIGRLAGTAIQVLSDGRTKGPSVDPDVCLAFAEPDPAVAWRVLQEAVEENITTQASGPYDLIEDDGVIGEYLDETLSLVANHERGENRGPGYPPATDEKVEVKTLITNKGPQMTFRLREGDQPLPEPNGTPHIHNAVADDLMARQKVGIARYGQPLQAGNGRDPSQDAYEEVLDLAVYLKQTNIEMEQMRQELVIAQDRLAAVEQIAFFSIEKPRLRLASIRDVLRAEDLA